MILQIFFLDGSSDKHDDKYSFIQPKSSFINFEQKCSK